MNELENMTNYGESDNDIALREAKELLEIAMAMATIGEYNTVYTSLKRIKDLYLDKGEMPPSYAVSHFDAYLASDVMGLEYVLKYGWVEDNGEYLRIANDASDNYKEFKASRKVLNLLLESVKKGELYELKTGPSYYKHISEKNTPRFFKELHNHLDSEQLEEAIDDLLNLFESQAARYKEKRSCWIKATKKAIKVSQIDELLSTQKTICNKKSGKKRADVIYIRDAKAHASYSINNGNVFLDLTTNELSYEEDITLTPMELVTSYNSMERKMNIISTMLVLNSLYSVCTRNSCILSNNCNNR